MCGIAGIWSFAGRVSSASIERFTESLLHRGPDDSGQFIDEGAGLGLGHRRLSILDLSEHGRQPMAYAGGRYRIVYNGEIFNFLELRGELVRAGHSFRTDTDTEVILAAYRQWGEACQFRFNGMWAFAIWDAEKRLLFLSRDRFGIKPLYYLHLPGKLFAFASETIAFANMEGFERSIDEENLSRVLEDVTSLEGYGRTIFKGIRQLKPGHFMLFRASEEPVERRWWSTLDHIPEIPFAYDAQVERFRELFEDACRLRLRSDVPVATALSGGVDSSSVYCMIRWLGKDGKKLSRLPEDWQRAFVVTFPGTRLDERAYAEEVIRFTGGSATYLEPDYSNLADRLVRATLESDFVYLTPPVAWDIYGGMKRAGVKVSLDGHGVDEMLFGYPNLVAAAYCEARRKGGKILPDELLSTYLEMHHPAERKNVAAKLQAYCRGQRLKMFYDRRLPVLLKTVYRRLRRLSGGSWVVRPVGPLAPGEDLSTLSDLDWLLYVNVHYSVLPTILRNFDRASMAHGVEVRMPFMDWRIVSFVFGLPMESKIGCGFTKRILRDSMRGLMPEAIRTRTLKIGINAPMVEWFSGELSEFIRDSVNSRSFLESSIWDGRAARDFALDKIEKRSWRWDDCIRFWPYLNAHILLEQGPKGPSS